MSQSATPASFPAEIRNRQGERLDFTVHQGTAGSRELVVIGHGVTGNKDRPHLVALAEGLAAAGIPALRLSFSGNGASEGDFTASTITKEVEDLGAALDALPGWNITYVGHSMGAAVGVLRASRDVRIKRLVSLAGMAHPAEFAQREFGAQQPGKDFMWDDEDCPLGETFMRDMAAIPGVADAARAITAPWLLVHGTADDVVPISDSEALVQAVGAERVSLVRIDGANHGFAEAHMPVMVATVLEWLRRVR